MRNKTSDQIHSALVREVDRLTCTVQQAVKLTGISDSQFYNLMKSGDLEYTHAAGRRLIYWHSLKKLVGLPA
ncbi:helix-turn-helix transcriptional regulator [Inquilinus limosus]|uniref:helix-turn-helix transcriptional regulator n=1 Tax=Inquilinus limosus TaxID=171674 RepID=UPI0012DF4F74|nr:excisionase [Inquilinus limosus]